jgi:hypothetical protein
MSLPADPPEPLRLYTRREGVTYIRERWGIPVTLARMARDAMTSSGGQPIEPVMPPPDQQFGNRYMYRGGTLDTYSKRLPKSRPAERGEAA